jgi:hypothetical protein
MACQTAFEGFGFRVSGLGFGRLPNGISRVIQEAVQTFQTPDLRKGKGEGDTRVRGGAYLIHGHTRP